MSPPYKRAFDKYVMDYGLPLTLQPVLYWLCDRANDKGECWPGRDTLARWCGSSERHIQRATRSLCDMGLIEMSERGGKSVAKHYRILLEPIGTGGLTVPLSNTHRETVSPPNNDHRETVSPDRETVSPDALINARAVLRDPDIDPVEEDTQIELDPDSRTGEPAASADVCVSLETKAAEESPHEGEPEPEPYDLQPDYSQLGGPVPATCRHYSEIACPCEQQALRTLTELFKARPTLAKPRRHPNLHVFLHAPGRTLDDLKLLVEDRLAREKDDDFLKIGTLFSPAKAEEDLTAAKARHEAEQAKRRRTICLHPADEVIHDERDDSFVCRACWCTISEQQAAKRGVQREGSGSDAEAQAGLQEFRQAIFGRASNRSQRHE